MAHETYHAAESMQTDHGAVIWVGCSCGWTAEVDVTGCDFWSGLERIYRARDEHAAMETLREAVDGTPADGERD